MNSKTAFRKLLTSIAYGRSALTSRQATAAFRRAFLDFGSDTDDNRDCAAVIGFCTVKNGRDRTMGLAVRRRHWLVTEILNSAEGSPVPAQVRRDFPRITQREWDAVLRLATMVLFFWERDSYDKRAS